MVKKKGRGSGVSRLYDYPLLLSVPSMLAKNQKYNFVFLKLVRRVTRSESRCGREGVSRKRKARQACRANSLKQFNFSDHEFYGELNNSPCLIEKKNKSHLKVVRFFFTNAEKTYILSHRWQQNAQG